MIRITKEMQQYKGEHGWLTTYHHFSFAEYYDPTRTGFGPLRVFNDDVIQAGAGFDMHRHENMEIVTYVIDGELEHRDSLGNHGIIRPGEIQRMSAGTGVMHSEFNHSTEKPLRLLQIWLFSDTWGLKPSWEQKRYSKEERRNRLLAVISPKDSKREESLSISQDATFYVSSLEPGTGQSHKLHKGRIAYLFVIEGKITLGNNVLHAKDTAEIEDEDSLDIRAESDAEIILIDMPADYKKNATARAG